MTASSVWDSEDIAGTNYTGSLGSSDCAYYFNQLVLSICVKVQDPKAIPDYKYNCLVDYIHTYII